MNKLLTAKFGPPTQNTKVYSNTDTAPGAHGNDIVPLAPDPMTSSDNLIKDMLTIGSAIAIG